MMNVEHIPGIKKLNPGMIDKSAKIASLSLRFEHKKIKIPLWKSTAPFRRLIDQIEQFNPDARDGGLQHDDELDCVCMSQFIIRGRLKSVGKIDLPNKTNLERLKDGEVFDETSGTYLAHGMNFNQLNVGDILEILDKDINDDPERTSRI